MTLLTSYWAAPIRPPYMSSHSQPSLRGCVTPPNYPSCGLSGVSCGSASGSSKDNSFVRKPCRCHLHAQCVLNPEEKQHLSVSLLRAWLDSAFQPRVSSGSLHAPAVKSPTRSRAASTSTAPLTPTTSRPTVVRTRSYAAERQVFGVVYCCFLSLKQA